MNWNRRLRLWVKWILAIASAIATLLWIGTIWWYLSISTAHFGSIALQKGQLSFFWFSTTRSKPSSVTVGSSAPMGGSFQWWFDSGTKALPGSAMGYWWIAVPLWCPALGLAIPAALLWKIDRRTKRLKSPHICASCGYDRIGIAPNASCPECGTPPR